MFNYCIFSMFTDDYSTPKRHNGNTKQMTDFGGGIQTQVLRNVFE